MDVVPKELIVLDVPLDFVLVEPEKDILDEHLVQYVVLVLDHNTRNDSLQDSF